MILTPKQVEDLTIDIDNDLQTIIIEHSYPAIDIFADRNIIKDGIVNAKKVIIAEQELNIVGLISSNIGNVIKQTILTMREDTLIALTEKYEYLVQVRKNKKSKS